MCRITHGLLQRESRGQEIYFQGLKNIPPCTRFPRWRCWWLGSCAQAILRWSAGSPPGPLSWTPHMSPPRAHAPVLGGCRRGRPSDGPQGPRPSAGSPAPQQWGACRAEPEITAAPRTCSQMLAIAKKTVQTEILFILIRDFSCSPPSAEGTLLV